MKIKPDWHEDTVTPAQLIMIQRIIRESDIPLPPFEGKTKGQAAVWIEQNKERARRSIK